MCLWGGDGMVNRPLNSISIDLHTHTGIFPVRVTIFFIDYYTSYKNLNKNLF